MFVFPGECEWPCPVPMSTGGAQEGDEHEFWGLASLQSSGKTLTGLLFTPSDDRKANFLSNSSYYVFWVSLTLNARFGLFKQSVFRQNIRHGVAIRKTCSVCWSDLHLCYHKRMLCCQQAGSHLVQDGSSQNERRLLSVGAQHPLKGLNSLTFTRK